MSNLTSPNNPYRDGIDNWTVEMEVEVRARLAAATVLAKEETERLRIKEDNETKRKEIEKRSYWLPSDATGLIIAFGLEVFVIQVVSHLVSTWWLK